MDILLPIIFCNQRDDLTFVSKFRRLSKKCINIANYWIIVISETNFLKVINIQVFTNLQRITCTNNLTDDDLRHLDKLTHLNASNNIKITNKSISHLTSLIWLKSHRM